MLGPSSEISPYSKPKVRFLAFLLLNPDNFRHNKKDNLLFLVVLKISIISGRVYFW